MLNILWFRRDLRVSDHRPLLTAVAEGLVAPIVIVEPEYWSQPFASARQWRFVGRAITALRSQLAVIGAPLVVRVGDAIQTIEALQEKSNDVAIWSHDLTGSAWEVERDARIKEWTEQQGIPWHRLPDNGGYLDHSQSEGLKFQETLLPPPDVMIAHGVTPGRVVSERILYLDDDPCTDLPAGPTAARRVLERFVSEARSGSVGRTEIEEAWSNLSLHLAWGTLSIREAWLELECLKPDCVDVACSLQDRILRYRIGSSSKERVPFATDVPSIDRVKQSITEFPLLTSALNKLCDHGLIREDVLAVLTRVSAAHLEVKPQVVLDSVAKLRTAYVESEDSIERYVISDDVSDFADARALDVILAKLGTDSSLQQLTR